MDNGTWRHRTVEPIPLGFQQGGKGMEPIPFGLLDFGLTWLSQCRCTDGKGDRCFIKGSEKGSFWGAPVIKALRVVVWLFPSMVAHFERDLWLSVHFVPFPKGLFLRVSLFQRSTCQTANIVKQQSLKFHVFAFRILPLPFLHCFRPRGPPVRGSQVPDRSRLGKMVSFDVPRQVDDRMGHGWGDGGVAGW